MSLDSVGADAVDKAAAADPEVPDAEMSDAEVPDVDAAPDADAGGGPGAPGADEEDGTARRWPARVAGLLVLVLIACGAVLLLKADELGDDPAAGNRALTDAAATERVSGDVSSALSTVFSYTPEDTAGTRKAARGLLAGKAARQYEGLFGQVERRAAEQKLTLTTHVVRAGVTRLTDRGAHLLVFLDQVAERQGRPATTVAAQLSVTAELHGGHWRIVDITSR
ncbi:hypothetical protein [Streptomyces sp. NPDC050504]|uniref:hypothetical protein n=1 Tax=Streptomyces sp. NPDC050504 TaxID=3365618 RepID=UPI0037A05C27